MENICQMLSILSVQNTALKPIVLDFDIVLVGKMEAIECNGAKEPQKYHTVILENQTHIRIHTNTPKATQINSNGNYCKTLSSSTW